MGLTHSIWPWIVIAVVVLVMFGSKRLPDAARGLGRSMRILKSEMSEMKSDSATPAEEPKQVAPQPDPPIDVQTVDPQTQNHNKTA